MRFVNMNPEKEKLYNQEKRFAAGTGTEILIMRSGYMNPERKKRKEKKIKLLVGTGNNEDWNYLSVLF